jgi:DNA polymerase III delta subunit
MIFYFYGPNSYMLRQQLNQMIEAYVKKAGSDFGLDRVDGATIKAKDLQATLQASPFMANSRLVIVEGLGQNKNIGDKLAGVLAHVPSSTVAVFVDREVDQRTVVYKTLSKAERVVKFEPMTGMQLAGWCAKEVERLGGTADRQTLQELIALTGDDQWRLSGELTKLVNYDAQVTRETVRALVAPSLDQTIFGMVEAMTAGRAGEALASYHSLLKQRESEIYILTMIQWQLRNLLLAKTGSALSQAELAKAAGMSPFVAGKMLNAQRRFREDTLKDAYTQAADCEFDIKTGRLKAEVAVEQLIRRVAAASKG